MKVASVATLYSITKLAGELVDSFNELIGGLSVAHFSGLSRGGEFWQAELQEDYRECRQCHLP